MENLKELTDLTSTYKLLYVEDDRETAEVFINYLSRLFKEVVYVEDGQQALEFYKQDKFDLVITDIMMPKLDGLEMSKEIKQINKEQNILVVSGYSNTETILSSIKIGIDGYLVKPINYSDMNNTIYKICTKIKKYKEITEHQKTLETLVTQITQKNNDLTQYVEILDHIAIISKTDLNGVIIDVNDFFCEVSEYSKEELVGKTHNIIRHENTAKTLYENLWNTIKAKKVWKGTIKNKTKNGASYFTLTTILPLFDENNQIKGYIAIRFLTTKEQEEKREFKKRVISTYQESRKENFNANKKIKFLNDEILNLKNDKEKQSQLICELAEKNQSFLIEMNSYEKENNYLKNLELASSNIKKMLSAYKDDHIKLETQQKELEFLQEEVKEKKILEEKIIEQEQIIENLKNQFS